MIDDLKAALRTMWRVMIAVAVAPFLAMLAMIPVAVFAMAVGKAPVLVEGWPTGRYFFLIFTVIIAASAAAVIVSRSED